MVPTTVHLEDGLHSKGVDILQPLDAVDCAACAKQIVNSKIEGDSVAIQKQLESTRRLFTDQIHKEITTGKQRLAVVHVMSEVGKDYCIFDRVVWDLNNPLAMIDVYCGTVVDTLGLGSMAAYTMAKEMRREVERLRKDLKVKIEGGTKDTELLCNVNPVRDAPVSLIRLPSVFKVSVANKLKECLKDCPVGKEDEYLNTLLVKVDDSII